MSIRTTGSVRTIGAVGATSTLLGGASSALLLALAASPAGAASTWTVDTLADGAANATDCTTPVVGSCSLRDALAAAAIGDTVTFSPTLFTGGAGTITLTNGQLVDDGVNVTGPGANLLTVDADGLSRVFEVQSTVSGTTISGVTVTGGYLGGADFGSAIVDYEGSHLILADVVVTGNSDGSGAVATYGRLTMSGSIVSNNSNYIGGGILVKGDTTITTSSITGNSAVIGGGAVAIYAEGTVSLSIIDSTISGNDGGLNGGGVFGYSTGGSVLIANSTLTGNTALYGGAIALGGASLQILMSTITGNTATGDGVPLYMGAGILVSSDASLPPIDLTGSIVAGNTAASAPSDITVTDEIPGPITAASAFIGTGVAPGLTLTGAGLLRGDDPRLGALADNGGPTRTMLPLPGSPVLNAGPATIPVFPGNEFDQRGAGFLRVIGTNADIGAVEIQAPPEPVVPHFTG